MIKIVTDGGASHNGTGKVHCYGSFYVEKDGKRIKHESRFPLPNCHTNNEAEYGAMIAALEYMYISQEKHPELCRVHITICSDSNLIVQQINGNYRVKSENLRPFRDHAVKLLKQLNFNRPLACVNVVWEQRAEICRILGH